MKEADNPKPKMSLPKLFWWNNQVEAVEPADEMPVTVDPRTDLSPQPQQVLDLSLLLQKLQDGVTKLSPDEISNQVIDAVPPNVEQPVSPSHLPELAEPACLQTSGQVSALPNDRPMATDSVPSIAALLSNPTAIAEFIQTLQQQNYDLVDRVNQLENLVNEYQATLDLQIARSQHQHTLLSHQQQEHSAAQEQVRQLMEDLTIANQSTQHQQQLVEKLTQQLAISQDQILRLEQDREQARQQTQEKNRQLTEATDACQDLRARLHRQQQYTLQFKAALEKSLEMAGEGQTLETFPSEMPEDFCSMVVAHQADNDALSAQVFLPKVKPIQPWTSAPKLFGEETMPIAPREASSADREDVSDLYWFNGATGDVLSEPSVKSEAAIDMFALNPDDLVGTTVAADAMMPSFVIAKSSTTQLTDTQLIDFSDLMDAQFIEASQLTTHGSESVGKVELEVGASSVESEVNDRADDTEISAILDALSKPATISPLDITFATADPEHEASLTGEALEVAFTSIPTIDALELASLELAITEPDISVVQLTDSMLAQTDGHPLDLEIDLWQEVNRVIDAPSEVAIADSSLFHSPAAEVAPAKPHSWQLPDYSVNGLVDNPWDGHVVETPTAPIVQAVTILPEAPETAIVDMPVNAPAELPFIAEPAVLASLETPIPYIEVLDNAQDAQLANLIDLTPALSSSSAEASTAPSVMAFPNPVMDAPLSIVAKSPDSVTNSLPTEVESELDIEPFPLEPRMRLGTYFRPGVLRPTRPMPVQPYSPEIATVRSPLSATPPSPVVYPDRPAKKLTSLAAVKLPTFPRNGRS